MKTKSKKKYPKPFKDAPKKILKNIKAVFFDIDDTITDNGKLKARSYNYLWKLKQANIKLIPVTGRPAAWCDHIIRFWPVDAIIGENGAFSFFMKENKRSSFNTLPINFKKNKERLEKLQNKLLQKFPDIKFSSDQNYREYDLAIDVCEDVAPLKRERVLSIINFLKKQKAQVKLSSIHINTWYGNYDKALGIKKWFLNDCPGVFKNLSLDEVIFIGDSPNDSPMFKFFKYSVGVANLDEFLEDLDNMPTWITKNRSGNGFCEFAKRILSH